jgi:hypothetical protein
MTHPFDFTAEDPIAMVEKLRRLANDIEALGAGNLPTSERLDAAPLLRHWVADRRPTLCLRGIVYGHPTIAYGHAAVTSQIFAIDPLRKWVRTYSRFYALGAPRPGGL